MLIDCLYRPNNIKKYYSCLGVTFDEKLNWEKHIDYICSKVGSGIEAVKRVKPLLFSPTLITVTHFGRTLVDVVSRRRYRNCAARVITAAMYDQLFYLIIFIGMS